MCTFCHNIADIIRASSCFVIPYTGAHIHTCTQKTTNIFKQLCRNFIRTKGREKTKYLFQIEANNGQRKTHNFQNSFSPFLYVFLSLLLATLKFHENLSAELWCAQVSDCRGKKCFTYLIGVAIEFQ